MTKNKSQIDIIDPIINNNLNGYEPGEHEYAPPKITQLEALIYYWVYSNIGMRYARLPLFDIHELAQFLREYLFEDVELNIPLIYDKPCEDSKKDE